MVMVEVQTRFMTSPTGLALADCAATALCRCQFVGKRRAAMRSKAVVMSAAVTSAVVRVITAINAASPIVLAIYL
jgi:hypothetical protein